MRAYSMDLRERALLDSDAGMKAADVAAKYRVSGSWVRLLKQRRRETGEVAPRVQRHGRRCMLEPHLHTLAALIAAQPDRTLAELKDALATPASVPTVWRAVRALGLTVKKKGLSGFPNAIFGPFGVFVNDLMGKALWKLVKNAQRFPRCGGRVLCVHGAGSFHRAHPYATRSPRPRTAVDP